VSHALEKLEFTAEELGDIDRYAVDVGVDLWRGLSSS
jgi:hypothetical protein